MTKKNVSLLAFELAGELRRRREALGMTQAELAAGAGVTVETVARLERVLRGRPSANANPSVETLDSIAVAMGCHITELLGAGRRSKPDPLVALIRAASPATRRRVKAILEALNRDDKRQRKDG